MSRYFSYFPKTFYTLNGESTSVDIITDILVRYKLSDDFKENSAAYYEYDVKDGDTPEIIASKFYGDAELHWLVLMANDMVDAQYDFPLSQRNLISYIDDKYTANANVSGQSGLEWAQVNTKQYFIIETTTNSLTDAIQTKKWEVDANTYANASVTFASKYESNAVSVVVSSGVATITLPEGSTISITQTTDVNTYYDYEVDLNDSKRTIKLIRPAIAQAIRDEFRKSVTRA
jgi:hypothetical protein